MATPACGGATASAPRGAAQSRPPALPHPFGSLSASDTSGRAKPRYSPVVEDSREVEHRVQNRTRQVNKRHKPVHRKWQKLAPVHDPRAKSLNHWLSESPPLVPLSLCRHLFTSKLTGDPATINGHECVPPAFSESPMRRRRSTRSHWEGQRQY